MEKSEKGTGRSKSHASRACTTCRRSRTRCLPGSKSSGVCARCETKGIECQWETGPDRRRNRADTQAHVEQLQTRIAELEAQLLLMSTHSCAAAVAPLARAAAVAESALPVPPPLKTDKMRAPTVERTSPTSTTTPPSAGQLQPDETGELHWHTETNVFDPTLADRHPQQKKAETLAFLPVPLDNKLHVELIELAFAWHLSVFRVLEREDVDICSERLTRYSPFVHLTVLATGSRYLHDAPPELHTDPSDPATRGEPFANAALELLVDELRNPKLSTIMGLCNLASYTGGVGAPRAGWLYAGLACRLCIDFGLHIDPLPTDPIDPSLRLIRRRLFWLCFSHDVSWAICLGRRSSFQLSEMHQPPLEPPPSAVAAQGAGTELLPGDGAAWPFEIRLNVLAWKIVELNYTDEGKRLGAQQRAERVVEVWRELGEFYESLPSIYRGPSMFIKSPDTLQLNLHYYMLIILLLKPFYAPTSATEIDPSIHHLALEQCAAAPMAILDLATKYEAAGLPLSFSSKNTYLALLHAGAMSVQIAASLLSPSAPSPPSPAPSSALSDPNSEFHHRLRAVDSSLRFLLEASKSWESCKQSMMVIGRLRAGLMERVREVQEKERGSERERLPPISVGQAVAAIPLTTAAVHQPQHHHQHQQQQQQPPPPSSGYPLPCLPPLTASPPEAPPSLAPPPPPPPHPAALPHSSALPYPGPLPTPPAAAYDPNLAFDLNFAIGGAGGGGVGYDQFVGMDGGPGGAVYGNGPGGVPLDSYLNSGWTVHNYLGTPTYLGGL